MKIKTNGKFSRHKWTFTINRSSATFSTANLDVRALVLANLGMTDQSIAERLGVTKGSVSYIIGKGGARGIRKAFRNGETPVARLALRLASPRVMEDISKNVSPKYL